MNEQIPVDENMPEDLKAAINYLNSHNLSLTDSFEEMELKEFDENSDIEEDDFDEESDIEEDDFDDEEDDDEDEEDDEDIEEDDEETDGETTDLDFGNPEKFDASSLNNLF